MYYLLVSRDISKLPDAIQFFQNELITAKLECKCTGSIEKLAASLPSIVENRFSQLQEIEAILNLLNIEFKRLKSQHFRKYLEQYARALSSRDCEKYVDGESDVVDFEKLVNEFALLRNQWIAITKGLDNKQWQITNVIKLRVAGLDDAEL